MIDLLNKRVLLIAPTFFGYEKSINKKLEERGAKVDYYDERPANTFWDKGLIRLNKNFLKKKIAKYYNQIYTDISQNQYDYVLVINIEAMPIKFLAQLREKVPSARFVLYMWDSISNKKETHNYLPFFDVIYSFDDNDCSKYPNIKFRPLFYLDEYKALRNQKEKNIYDISFIGTAHSDRLSILNKLKKSIEACNILFYSYVFLHSKKLFFWNKLTNPSFKNVRVEDCSYIPLSKDDVINIIRNSKIVIDIQHPGQNGLTMRTIEMLGAERKLITTNQSIMKYDFFRPENICILDRYNPKIPKDFLGTSYISLDDKLYYKYSLDGWLNEILS